MNVYAHARDTFDEQAQRLGEIFAVPAAVSVQNAQILAQTERLTTQLQAALTNRAVIDQAIGILRAHAGVSAQEALTRLQQVSQRENRKVSEVATDLVQAAVDRARRRLTPPPPTPGSRP